MFLILFFFERFGAFAWFYAWLVLSSFLVLLQPLFTLVIAPMFNTFTPLEDGELKDRIISFAKSVNFPISRIDVMDGSRRSSKANAYFSGLGKNKRIALFDTLIEKHSVDECHRTFANLHIFHTLQFKTCKINTKSQNSSRHRILAVSII